MGGIEPPFLYDPPSRFSFNGPTDKAFNPKAATVASWTPSPQRPKQEGPLVNFNRHPDSYSVPSYGNTKATPMSPRTKDKIKWSRSIQLVLRICEFLGAIGMLVCVISVRGTPGTVGWIIRAAPAIGLLHSLYGTYHLSRKATGRTPGSSASYHIFACVIDSALIPFYVFSALVSRYEYTSDDKKWGTLFSDDSATPKVVQATYLFSIANCGMHIASLLLSLYLALIFRKISKLPPDMNPLEDNLTARPHKRNKSSVSVPAPSSDKHLNQTTTMASSNRLSNPFTDDSPISQTRRMPFMHTRTDSTDSLPGRAPAHLDSKRHSRADLPSQKLYEQNMAAQSTRRTGLPQRQTYQHSPHSAHSSRTDLRIPPKLSGRGQDASPRDSPPPLTVNPLQDSEPRPHRRTSHSSLTKDNWFTYPSASPSPPTPNPLSAGRLAYNDENRPPSPVSDLDQDEQVSESSHSRTNTGISSIKDFNLTSLRNARGLYAPLDSSPRPPPASPQPKENLYDFDRDLATPAAPTFVDTDAELVKSSLLDNSDTNPTLRQWKKTTTSPPKPQPQPQPQTPVNAAKRFWQLQDSNLKPHPLESNPPTPPPPPPNQRQRPQLAEGDSNRPGGGGGPGRPSSFIGSGGKTRFYGDLRRSWGRDSLGGGGNNNEGLLVSSSSLSPPHLPPSSSSSPSTAAAAAAAAADDGKGRVVSNSGADVGYTYYYGNGGFGKAGNAYSKVGGMSAMAVGPMMTTTTAGGGGGRRRDVSGKVAEEGRGHRTWWA